MNTFLKILRLDFVPLSTDLPLLALRLWLGLTLLLNHGLGKLLTFGEKASNFPDPLGVGSAVSLGLAVFGEVVCSALLVMGLLGRVAALGLTINMSVAFFLVHKGSLKMGPGSGELAFIYLAGFVALLLAGTGRFSLDRLLFAKPASGKA
ncbi:MAG TPA: DoxX family protein [Verrucomicrobiae bacterium]|nr:DoxX family protein [Verrucomicrobiae bacterium]